MDSGAGIGTSLGQQNGATLSSPNQPASASQPFAFHRQSSETMAEGYLNISRRMGASQPGKAANQSMTPAELTAPQAPARKYGIIVFGATGVAGKRVLVELACSAKGIKWAACGRDKAKVQQSLVELGLAGVDVLQADATDDKSLERTFCQAEVIINCTGPYRYLGLQVVRACLATSTHYVDVTGETDFIMKSELMYHEHAARSEILIVHCCGFDSIPADEGVLFTTEQLGCTSFVESFMSFYTGPQGMRINSTTFEAAMLGMKDAETTRQTRKKLLASRLACGRDFQGPLLKVKDHYWEERIKGTAVKFPGADATVVKTAAIYRSARTGEPEVQYAAYFNAGTTWDALRLGFHDQLVKATSSIAGVETVLNNASFFTAGLVQDGGPADDMIAETTFDLKFFAMGWKEKLQGPTAQYEGFPTWQVVTKVSGPEPAYVATAICAASAALTLLLDKIVLPYKGGVLMPSEAFWGTRFRKRLIARGIKFEVLSSKRHIYSADQADTATHWERDLAPRRINHWEHSLMKPFQAWTTTEPPPSKATTAPFPTSKPAAPAAAAAAPNAPATLQPQPSQAPHQQPAAPLQPLQPSQHPPTLQPPAAHPPQPPSLQAPQTHTQGPAGPMQPLQQAPPPPTLASAPPLPPGAPQMAPAAPAVV